MLCLLPTLLLGAPPPPLPLPHLFLSATLSLLLSYHKGFKTDLYSLRPVSCLQTLAKVTFPFLYVSNYFNGIGHIFIYNGFFVAICLTVSSMFILFSKYSEIFPQWPTTPERTLCVKQEAMP